MILATIYLLLQRSDLCQCFQEILLQLRKGAVRCSVAADQYVIPTRLGMTWQHIIRERPQTSLDPVTDNRIANLFGCRKAHTQKSRIYGRGIARSLQDHSGGCPFAPNSCNAEEIRAFFQSFDACRHCIRLKGSCGL